MIGLLDILEAYEAGYLDTRETFDLFAELIRAERVWNLEKPYPQTARHLIAAGYLTPDGKITKRGRAWIVDEGREGYPWDVNPRIDGASDEPIPRCFWAPGAAA